MQKTSSKSTSNLWQLQDATSRRHSGANNVGRNALDGPKRATQRTRAIEYCRSNGKAKSEIGRNHLKQISTESIFSFQDRRLAFGENSQTLRENACAAGRDSFIMEQDSIKPEG
jgi:hypothetical protein